MPGFSDERICKQTELIAICYINTPDKEIKTVRKKKKKKKKKTIQVPIVALFRSHKGECIAEATVQNKSSYQQGQMFKSGLHSYRNYTWKYVTKGHISSVLLITKRFAVPRLLVVKIHGFLIIDPTTLFLDIAHLLVSKSVQNNAW